MTKFDYKLYKANTTEPIRFPATPDEAGRLIGSSGPMLIGDEVKAAGFDVSDTQVPVDQLPLALQNLVLKVGDNRGHRVEKCLTVDERIALAKEERKRENAFLKSKGWKWEKRSYYASGPGEMWEGWWLLNPEGEEVKGMEEIGEEPVATGPSVKSILTDLGYYGEEARQEQIAARKARKERLEAKKVFEDWFRANRFRGEDIPFSAKGWQELYDGIFVNLHTPNEPIQLVYKYFDEVLRREFPPVAEAVWNAIETLIELQ